MFPVIGGQYIRATLLADEFLVGTNDLALIDSMSSCRFWIDPILKSRLVDAKKNKDTRSIVRYHAALLPTHLEMRDTLYSQILPIKMKYGYFINPFSDYAMMILQKYDPGFATRMWEIAADNRGDIWLRYCAVEKLITIDPSNARWSEIIPELIAAYDFARDRDLYFRSFPSFERMSANDMDSRLKEQFREALIRKIDRCSESSFPWPLLSNFFTKERGLDLIVDGYLNGHFSLDSFGDYVTFQERMSSSQIRALLAKRPSNRNTDRRRELVLRTYPSR